MIFTQEKSHLNVGSYRLLQSKRIEMHPHTFLIHWMLKLLVCFKARNAETPETPLNQHALGGIRKRRKASWLPQHMSSALYSLQ